MPNRVNVITPEKAACLGFAISYKDHTTLVLDYPKTISKNWRATSVTIDYQINGEGAFVSRVPYNELEDKPYVWIGFHEGFNLDHDARIDVSYTCIDCEYERSEFYSIESIKKFSELSETSENEFVCNESVISN